jgi:apolipoprotein D and lipocalin family protein
MKDKIKKSVLLTLFHNVFNGPAVDIFVNSKKVLANVKYLDASPYLKVHFLCKQKHHEGKISLIVKVANSDTVVLNTFLEVRANRAYTCVITGLISDLATIKPELFEDNLQCPKAGKSHVRFLNVATGAPALDFYMNNNVVFTNVKFGESGKPSYSPVNPGLSLVTITNHKSATPLGKATSVFLESGGIYTIMVTGLPTALSTVMTIDRQSLSCDTLQEDFQVKKYLGKWYEIARIPQPFEAPCKKLSPDGKFRATAVYDLIDSATLSVDNTCYNKDFTSSYSVKGTAKILNKNVPSALHVSFPGFPDPLPEVANYLVHKTNYVYAVVGSPDRSNLYILYRKSAMSKDKYKQLVHFSKSLGYDTSKLEINYHGIKREK